MTRSVLLRLLVPCCLLAVLFTGCSRDPNARKQKYFDSGEKYFSEGKYREAVIQFSNAIQIDPRFAQGHAQLAQSYLKLGDTQRAYNELSRTLELTPDDYRAHLDLANLHGNPECRTGPRFDRLTPLLDVGQNPPVECQPRDQQ